MPEHVRPEQPPDPERLRVARPSYFSQESHDADGAFVPQPGARRFDPNWVPTSSLAGLRSAIAAHPDWRFERAAAMAERCRELLEAAAQDVVTPSERATLVSWRPQDEETGDVVSRLAEENINVRDLPGTRLVRASVGWWTSENDLERLVAAL